MNLVELITILEATGYPVAYSHFEGTIDDPVPDPPYICVVSPYSSNFIADNKVFLEIDNIQIELYTYKKDLTAEAKVKSVLNNNNIPFQTTETFIESEKLYQKIYETRLL